MSMPLLSLLECRVLGVLVEKETDGPRHLSAVSERADRRLQPEEQP